MNHVRVVLMTAPDEDTAAKIARVLVEERLAACVNIVPRIRSVYRWEGKVEDGAEVLCLVKTVVERVPALLARVQEVHPYQVPEGLALPVESGLADYLGWVVDETAPRVL